MGNILVVNCGSSSLKYKVFSTPGFEQLYKGAVEQIGEIDSSIKNHKQAIASIFDELSSEGIEKTSIKGVGHRVVHGGEAFKEPVIIDKNVIAGIKENIKLAPLHNPANLEGIIACMEAMPDIRQVAVFDTAFHSTIPKHAYMYPIPYEMYEKYRIRKYGFHGTSHAYVAAKAAEILERPLSELKLITVHMGNGCSISAVDKGRCIDTSMGFTPLSGLMMGTRCGDVDPALPLYIINELHYSATKVDTMLNKESGIAGISGISNDVRTIKQAVEKGESRACLALDMYLYSVKKYIGSYMYILGGIDAIVFTAGVGENNPDLVHELTEDLGDILKSKPEILVIPTEEELRIATLTHGLLRG